MMNQQKTSKVGILKYLLIAPLALALVVSSNAETIIKSAKEKIQEKTSFQSKTKGNAINEITVVGYAAENVTPVTPIAKEVVNNDNTQTKKSNNQVFQVVEKMPTFPGGQNSLMKYLRENIKYPVIAQKNGIQGRVICQFVVTKNGSISEIKVIRSVDPSLDAEAVRIVKEMPNWTPGEEKGKKVNVHYTLPINFALQGKSEDKKSSGDKETTFMVVEEMPKYPGGDSEMFKFISENMKYPLEAKEKGIQGRVICSFVVNKDGSIDDVIVVRSIDKYLDNEAVRVIKAMPKWTPGKQKGEAVPVKYALPLNFKLSSEPTTNPWGNNPIVILDGQRMSPKFNIEIIKPENIEKINVLKPDSEESKKDITSKFGKWASNGVIEITTKK